MPGEELTKLSSWPEAPASVRAVFTVWVPEAGRVMVLAVVSSRSSVSKVLLPVIVKPAEPVEVCFRVG